MIERSNLMPDLIDKLAELIIDDNAVLVISTQPRYVDEDLCTGCRQCEYACPIDLPNAFDRNLGAIRAIRVPFHDFVREASAGKHLRR